MRLITAAFLVSFTLAPLFSGCSKQPSEEATADVESTASSAAGPQEAVGEPPPGELVITELAPGSGSAIAVGSTAIVHYTGWLYDPAAPDHKGSKFDSSRDRNEPFRFPVGQGQVIQGWDKGVEGMKVGQQVRLTIPPSLGYG